MTRACRCCQWWLAEAGGSGGECRGAPPTPVATLDGPDAIWPRTGAFMWCGAFRMAEHVITPRPAASSLAVQRGDDLPTDAEFSAAHAAFAERLATVGRKGEGEH